jgi:hypothetical protein
MVYLETIILIIFLSISSAFFGYFIDFCFENGNIFDFYYIFIEEKFSENYPKIFKVLGGCIICFNFWLSFLLFHIFFFVFPLQYILIVPFLSISQFTIMKLVGR